MKNLPSYLFKFLLVALAIFTAAGFYFWQAKGMRFYSVQSSSMAPALRVGDLIVNEKIEPMSVKIGDIISYASIADPRIIITHRVVRADIQKGIIITQGDNLTVADPPVSYGSILGKNIKTIPLAGYLLDALKNPLGLVALIYIPVLAIGIVEIKKLTGRFGDPYKHPKLS